MRVGYSQLDITPQIPVEMAGYGYFLDRVADSVDTPLLASTLAFEGDDGSRVAVCGTDALMIEEETAAKVYDQVVAMSRGDLEGMTLLLNTSHTHSGPSLYPVPGGGGHNREYVDNVYIPQVARGIVSAFTNDSEGEVGIGRTPMPAIGYNDREDGGILDDRLSVLRLATERGGFALASFGCHPVVYGKNSTVISSDYPGYARQVMAASSGIQGTAWLTGFCGDVDPQVNKDRKGNTTREDVVAMGRRIGEGAVGLYRNIATENTTVQAHATHVALPVDTDFELDPRRETEVFREGRRLPADRDLSTLTRWFSEMAPRVNSDTSETVSVPVVVVRLGSIILVGAGAELYSQTGLAIGAAQPNHEVVTLGTTNGNYGYVPTAAEFDRNPYTSHTSFTFSRKPLRANAEASFRTQVTDILSDLTAA